MSNYTNEEKIIEKDYKKESSFINQKYDSYIENSSVDEEFKAWIIIASVIIGGLFYAIICVSRGYSNGEYVGIKFDVVATFIVAIIIGGIVGMIIGGIIACLLFVYAKNTNAFYKDYYNSLRNKDLLSAKDKMNVQLNAAKKQELVRMQQEKAEQRRKQEQEDYIKSIEESAQVLKCQESTEKLRSVMIVIIKKFLACADHSEYIRNIDVTIKYKVSLTNIEINAFQNIDDELKVLDYEKNEYDKNNPLKTILFKKELIWDLDTYMQCDALNRVLAELIERNLIEDNKLSSVKTKCIKNKGSIHYIEPNEFCGTFTGWR